MGSVVRMFSWPVGSLKPRLDLLPVARTKALLPFARLRCARNARKELGLANGYQKGGPPSE